MSPVRSRRKLWRFSSPLVNCGIEKQKGDGSTIYLAAPRPSAGWSNLDLRWIGNDGCLSAMEYPHWPIVAGAILVVLGFIGFGFRQKQER